ncbi:MAG: SDR family NAD(P)-dependent oxidoreductase [Steroidobacteraceae bacterium]
MSLKERYGPWALIVGGSEGIGDHLARRLGRAGINIIMVARKPATLAETSRRIRDETGVEVRTLQLDIGRDDMLERIREVTDGLEVGMLIHNVGGGQGFGPFVDCTLAEVMAAVLANPVALTKLAHHFGKPMAERGRGGILMIGSLAGNAGCYFLATYSAAKAFNQILMEALWAEFQPRGVDVLAFPIGAADTPARARSGTVDAKEMPVARPEDIAQQALDELPRGPVYVSPENVEYFKSLCSMPRRDAAESQRDLLLRMLRAPADS